MIAWLRRRLRKYWLPQMYRCDRSNGGDQVLRAAHL